MTKRQWGVIIALGFAVIVIFCSLGMLIVSDVYKEFELLFALLRAELTPVPTVIYIPSPPPTDTPPASRPSISSAEEAIALVQNYRYDQAQGQTIASLISTLLAASERMGNELLVKGWWGEDQGNDQWIVTFSFWENSSPTVYKFWADIVAGTVEGYNERANALLTFLHQGPSPPGGAPGPTPIVVPIEGVVRDPASHWEYSVTARPQWAELIIGPDEELGSDDGFLIIPLRLANVGPEPQMVDSDYYPRFSLHDEEGRLAAHLGSDGFIRPTRLYCEAQGLPHFVMRRRSVASGESVDTALVFALLPTATGSLTLDVTTYRGNAPYTFSFELGLPQ